MNLHNFGCDKIYVISRDDAIQRRKDFSDVWGMFDNFEYVFVDAIKGEDIEVKSTVFYDKVASFSKNIYATNLSHRKIYEMIISNEEAIDSTYLILEDDVRPTDYFFESIENGVLENTINDLKKYTWDLFYWGRQKKKIHSLKYTDYLAIPTLFTDFGAHSYSISKAFALELYRNQTSVEMAADVYLDYQCYLKQKHYYSPYLSFFRQKQHIDEVWFREKNDSLYHYNSSTQRNYKELGERSGDSKWIHENIEHLIDNIDDVLLHDEIEMKKITFKKKTTI